MANSGGRRPSARVRGSFLVGALGAAGLAACSVSNSGSPGRAYVVGSEDAGPGTNSDGGASSTSLPLRPLTPFEVSNALQDLIGDPGVEILALHPGTVHGAAETLAGGDSTWSGARADRLEAATLAVAQRVVASGVLAPCAALPEEDVSCMDGFYSDFLPRAFRRPLGPESIARFTGVVQSLRGRTDRPAALARSLQAALLSPEFLYLTAFGDPARPLDDGLELTPYELAERLSFFVWASLPDAELAAAAGRDELRQPAQIEAQFRRMLKDPRAGRGLGRYVADWTGAINLSNYPKTDAAWNATLAYEATQETQLFTADWFREGTPTFAGLFDSDSTFVTPGLASFYGLPPAAEGFVKVRGTKAVHRTGVLTQAAFLASHANISSPSPVRRGEWVIKRALCETIGAPPNDTQDQAPLRDPSAQNRDWYEAIAATSNCSGCHERMNPPGYPFESYDSTGRHRTMEQGRPVRTDSTLSARHGDLQGTYADAESFARAVGQSAITRRCFTQGMFTYALGRAPVPDDAPLVDAVAAGLATNAQDATLSLVTSNAFRRATR